MNTGAIAGAEWSEGDIRVLADCKAKRRIAELHRPFASGFGDMRVCSMDESVEPCETLLALGAIYADHPDYREEWRA